MGETLTLKQIHDEVANLDILDMVFPVEREGKNLVLTPEILAMFKPDSTGRLHPIVNSSGEFTEVSASGQAANINNLRDYSRYGMPGPLFGVAPASTGVNKTQKRIAVVPIVTDGAGDSAVVALTGGVAGYQPCMRLLYIYADGSDGAWDLALTVSAGALTGMPTFAGLATTVNVIGPDWTPGGLLYQADTDAAIIQAQISNGGNVITYFFVFVWWEET